MVFKDSPRSAIAGKLILGDRSVIATGASIRAAGGVIELGECSGIGENSTAVASNHKISRDHMHLYTDWDEERTGVKLGKNVWVGANCVLLPGTEIGENTVIGAGSVVRGTVPANEIWAGTPAKKIRDI